MPDLALILASSSPRRRDLLSLTGVPFCTIHVDIDEQAMSAESAYDYVSRLATEKAEAAVRLIASDRDSKYRADKVVVLGADTSVVAGAEMLGKPADYADAQRMLRLLSDGWHEVYTAVSLLSVTEQANQLLGLSKVPVVFSKMPVVYSKVPVVNSKVVVSKVKFRQLADSEIQWYWDSGEPKDKAGSYAIQGRGGLFIEQIEGSYSGIVGLPLCETAELLCQAGFCVGSRKYE